MIFLYDGQSFFLNFFLKKNQEKSFVRHGEKS